MSRPLPNTDMNGDMHVSKASASWSRMHPLLMLGAAALSLSIGSAWPAAIAGGVALGVHVALHRGRWTNAGGFGAANAITSLRLVLILSLAPLCARSAGPAAAMLVLAIFALDGLDGRVARSHGQASAFGASYDMECDALLVLLCSLVLFIQRRLGFFILIPGVLRYLYAALIALYPAARGEAPRSRIARYVFAVLVTSFVASLWPFEPLHRPLAYVATALIVYSFGRSFYWSLRSA